jgi:hypothetical protein
MLRPLRLYHAFAVDIFLSPFWLVYAPLFFASFLFLFSLEYDMLTLATKALLSLLALVALFILLVGHTILKARLLSYYELDFLSLTLSPFGDKITPPPQNIFQNISPAADAPITPRALFFPHLLTFIYYFFCIITLLFIGFLFDAYTDNLLITAFLNLLTLTTVFLFVTNLIPCPPFASGYILLSFALKFIPHKNIISPLFTNGALIMASFILLFAFSLLITNKIPLLAALWFMLFALFILKARHHFKKLLRFLPLKSIHLRRTLHPSELKKDWQSLSASQNLTDAASLIHRTRGPLYPVLDRALCLGIITPSDLFAIEREAWPLTHLGSIMTPLDQLVLVTLTDPLDDIRKKLIASPLGFALVMGDDRETLLGYLTLKDLLALTDDPVKA